MDGIELEIHEIVSCAQHPMNANQIFQELCDRGSFNADLEKVRKATDQLVQKGFLVDAELPSYFAIG